MEVGHFSHQLESAISDLIPSNDALDRPNFDPIQYLNRMFPDEESLAKVDVAMKKMKILLVRTDEEILSHVRKQSAAGARGRVELDKAKQSIRELFSQIQLIRERAEKSEEMVQEICRDISLDYAKKHLTLTITTLKRLNMFITGVDQLKGMSERRQYKEVADLLKALSSLAPCFDDFQHIERVVAAKKEFMQLQIKCSDQVYEEFERLTGDEATPAYFADLCAVVDALGTDARMQFVSWFVTDRLLDYHETFSDSEDISKLENIKVRFQWLRRELQFYQAHFDATFPSEWQMMELISEEFCLVTKEKLQALLSDMKQSGTLNVKVLVSAMRTAIDFEKELNKRFSHSARPALHPGGGGGGAGSGEDEEGSVDPAEAEIAAMETQLATLNPHAPDALKLKWKIFQLKKSRTASSTLTTQVAKVKPSTRYSKILSSVFEAYLGIYVKSEDEELGSTLSRLAKSDGYVESSKLYESGVVMFDQFNDVRAFCAELSTGKTYLKVAGVFKKYLRSYADMLFAKLPKKGQRWKEGDDKAVCFVVNTADYCIATLERMEKDLKRQLDKEYREKLSMEAERDRFQTVLAKGVHALVNGLEGLLEPALTQMTKMNWSAVQAVGDCSPYVPLVGQAIRATVPVFHKWLSQARFNFFCDAFANDFIPRLRQAIYDCKLISAVGAEQLLLDVAHIKKLLDSLPKQGLVDRVPSRYKRILQKDIGRVECILKVVMAPDVAILDNYCALVQRGSIAELQQILDLKGIKKADQSALLQRYQQRTKK